MESRQRGTHQRTPRVDEAKLPRTAGEPGSTSRGQPDPGCSLCLRRALRRRLWLPLQHTRVHRLPSSGNCLEVQLISCDLDQHEASVCVEACCHDLRFVAQIVVAELAGVSYKIKIVSFLRLETLIYMIVP